jgi:hypothetical protein
VTSRLPAPPTPHTLADIAKRLNRSSVVISGFQNRIELPSLDGAAYSDAYLAFLRTVVYLRTVGLAEDRLLRLWHLEKKLLQLNHVDSAGSKTWFLDSGGAITRRDRRLLLTNYDIGIAVPAHAIQLDTVRVTLSHLGGGLVAKGGESLKWFVIAGADMKFVPAEARIDGDTVVVSSPEVTAPVAMRYAWANFPDGCNLYNAAGLPAAPFRTDAPKPAE